jgi:uncharacterized membrane protein YdjX (TVP38/TMEM64 family)
VWAWLKERRTAVIAVLFWLVLIAVTRQYMTINNVGFSELAVQLQTVLTTAWYGPLLYLLVYLLRPVILFPASLLTILGGNVFGLWPGFLYVLVAGTVSAAIPYGIGRWFAKEEAHKPLDESAIQRFIRVLRRNPFQAVLTMRLIYLPYDAVSFVAGSLRIPFLLFMLATLIGNVAGTLSFVGVGASIEGDLAAGEVSLNPAVLVFSGIVLIASIAVSRIMSRSQQSKPEEVS